MAMARSRLPLEQQRRTLVVVPQFLNGLDKAKLQPGSPANLIVFKSNGWGEGAPAVHPGAVSSFEALDAIVEHFGDRRVYPLVGRMVLSGHSMGAQLVHRYSILGSPRHGVDYVVLNPASYLYFDSHRPGPAAAGMNVYKYGFDQLLDKIPTYPAIQHTQDPSFYAQRLLTERRVSYVHGEADRGVGDERSEAVAQGANRAERARNYHRHLEAIEANVGAEGTRLWSVDWVAKVGHDGRAMTSSSAALARIFHHSPP